MFKYIITILRQFYPTKLTSYLILVDLNPTHQFLQDSKTLKPKGTKVGHVTNCNMDIIRNGTVIS